jgi:hypothetical protein
LWWIVANPVCRLRSWVATLHRLQSTTSSCFSCHHAARTWSCLATRSIESSLLVSPLHGGPARLISFTLALHLPQSKSSRNLHLHIRPRVSPHHVVIYSSNQGGTIHRSSVYPLTSAFTTHIVTNLWKQKKKRNEQKTQTSDQKPNKSQRSLEREKSRSPKARATSQHNRDQNMLTPQGEAKGLDTIGKSAQLKFRQHKELPLHECKLPLNKCISLLCCKNSPWMQKGYFLALDMNWFTCVPLVGNAWIKATNASMCFSNRQRALQYAKIDT